MSTPEPEPLASRKRKETSWVTDNADPLSKRNKKQKALANTNPRANPRAKPAAAKSARMSTRTNSPVEIEEEVDVANLVHQEHLKNPNHILERADGSDDDDLDDPAPPLMAVDDDDVDEKKDDAQEEEPAEESADSELGESLIDVDRCGSQCSL
jgi:hypothetical protein